MDHIEYIDLFIAYGFCISIPLEKMEYVMQHVKDNTKIIIRMQP